MSLGIVDLSVQQVGTGSQVVTDVAHWIPPSISIAVLTTEANTGSHVADSIEFH